MPCVPLEAGGLKAVRPVLEAGGLKELAAAVTQPRRIDGALIISNEQEEPGPTPDLDPRLTPTGPASMLVGRCAH